MEPGHFHTCRLQGDISLIELSSPLILFDASGCNVLLLKTTSASGDHQLTGFSSNSEHMYYRLHTVWIFHMELGHSICSTVLEPHQKRVRQTLPECFRTTKRPCPILVTGFSNALVSWPNVFWNYILSYFGGCFIFMLELEIVFVIIWKQVPANL